MYRLRHRRSAALYLLAGLTPHNMLLLTRQLASAFNQPLSLDTSSVTDMRYMLSVRYARALHPVSSWALSLHVACAAVVPPPSIS